MSICGRVLHGDYTACIKLYPTTSHEVCYQEAHSTDRQKCGCHPGIMFSLVMWEPEPISQMYGYNAG